jgi:hypothetical protein
MTRTFQPIRADEADNLPAARAEDDGRSSPADRAVCRTFERRCKIVKKLIVVVLTAASLVGTAQAATPARWTRYFDRRSGNVVFIKTACLTAEDSAAHLKLIKFEDHVAGKPAAKVVYGCYKKGY